MHESQVLSSSTKPRLMRSVPQKKAVIPNVCDDFDDDELLRLADGNELEHVSLTVQSVGFIANVCTPALFLTHDVLQRVL